MGSVKHYVVSSCNCVIISSYHRVVVSCDLSMKFTKIYRILDFCSQVLFGLVPYKKDNLMSELLILQSLSIGHTNNEI